MYRICVVEDSTELQEQIKRELSSWYHITSALTIQAAKELLAKEEIHLVLLDVDLPDGNGFEFCALLKNDRHTKDIPVIYLTGKNEPLSKMIGFSMGAVDYVVKPFEPIEIRARIEARLKYLTKKIEIPNGGMLTVGPLQFDLNKQRASVFHETSSRDLNLTPLEFKLLHFLASHESKIFSRSELLKAVIESNVHVKEDNIYTHVSAIRKKLGTQKELIECLPRVGYRLLAPQKKAA